MESQKEHSAEKLFGRQIISEQQLIDIKAYGSLKIFSVHGELLLLLYAAVLMISGGLGILVYKNIDKIGHSILIALVFLAAIASFYFSLKKAPGFSVQETFFPNPVFDYLVLLGTLLSGTFFGYLQYQYSPLGNDFALAALFTSAAGFWAAYRFDNRSSLSVAITALATTVGITITPKAVMDFDVFEHLPLFYIGILLGAVLLAWGEYSERKKLKKHFAPVFYGFAQHLTGICCIVGLCQDFWLVFALLMAASLFYFFKKSHEVHSAAMFMSSPIYGFIGFNIALVRLLMFSESESLMVACMCLAPFFYMGAIVLFVINVRKFNKSR